MPCGRRRCRTSRSPLGRRNEGTTNTQTKTHTQKRSSAAAPSGQRALIAVLAFPFLSRMHSISLHCIARVEPVVCACACCAMNPSATIATSSGSRRRDHCGRLRQRTGGPAPLQRVAIAADGVRFICESKQPRQRQPAIAREIKWAAIVDETRQPKSDEIKQRAHCGLRAGRSGAESQCTPSAPGCAALGGQTRGEATGARRDCTACRWDCR